MREDELEPPPHSGWAAEIGKNLSENRAHNMAGTHKQLAAMPYGVKTKSSQASTNQLVAKIDNE